MTDLHPLHVRLTTAELADVHAKARNAGHPTTAAYVRALLGFPALWRGRQERPEVPRASEESTSGRDKKVARRARGG
jgi:hypothetical protein